MSSAAERMHSALYEGQVSHRRHREVTHWFSAPVTMCYVDLDELDAVLAQHPLWSTRRWHPVQIRRTDYGGDPAVALPEALRRAGRSVAGMPIGPVRLLAAPRTWGWSFNPLALGFCFDHLDESVAAVVATVTNTPWGERHDYVLRAGDDGTVDTRVVKALHVSPFFPMQQRYRFRISPPGETLQVQVDVEEEGRNVLQADLRMRRRPLDRRAMTDLALRHPALAWRVSAGIYWQAVRLAIKGARVHPHPSKHPHPSSSPHASDRRQW